MFVCFEAINHSLENKFWILNESSAFRLLLCRTEQHFWEVLQVIQVLHHLLFLYHNHCRLRQIRPDVFEIGRGNWNSIPWHSKFFRGLLVCHTFLDMADDFEFFFYGSFSNFLFTVYIFFNYLWIKTNSLNPVHSKKGSNLSFEPCALKSNSS